MAEKSDLAFFRYRLFSTRARLARAQQGTRLVSRVRATTPDPHRPRDKHVRHGVSPDGRRSAGRPPRLRQEGLQGSQKGDALQRGHRRGDRGEAHHLPLRQAHRPGRAQARAHSQRHREYSSSLADVAKKASKARPHHSFIIPNQKNLIRGSIPVGETSRASR